MVELGKLPFAERAAWLLRNVVDPTLAHLRKLGIPSDVRARVMLLAIAAQESGIEYRDQVDAPWRDVLGPALGLWQFERGGGVAGVLKHPASKQVATAICRAVDVTPQSDAVWRALKVNDHLACAFARLLLWTDPAPLPCVTDSAGGWDYYLRCWRPGKPHPETWPRNWAVVRETSAQSI